MRPRRRRAAARRALAAGARPRGARRERLLARARGLRDDPHPGPRGHRPDPARRRPPLADRRAPLVPGDFANYPGGEVFVAPHADGADGVLVADLTVPYTVEGLVDEPVTLRFERGRVISIEGGRAAALLRELVDEAGEGADVIAELGIGLNPTVTPRGHVMLDEKAARHRPRRDRPQHGHATAATTRRRSTSTASSRRPRLEADGRPVESREQHDRRAVQPEIPDPSASTARSTRSRRGGRSLRQIWAPLAVLARPGRQVRLRVREVLAVDLHRGRRLRAALGLAVRGRLRAADPRARARPLRRGAAAGAATPSLRRSSSRSSAPTSR